MERLAERGEFVRYIGKIEYATDSATFEIMTNIMIVGNIYTVGRICDYTGQNDMHYILKENRFAIPCKSFIVLNIREYIKIKYNLI